MRRDAIFGILGNVTNSITSFGLQIALIIFASKEEYAWFALVSSYFLLGLGIQNAMINVPLTVILGGISNQEREQSVRALASWVIIGGSGFCLVASLLLYMFIQISLPNALVIGLCFVTLWIREFYRSAAYSLDSVKRSSILDVTNAVFILVLLSLLIFNFGTIDSGQAFLMLGISTTVTTLPWMVTFIPSFSKFCHGKKLTEHARWALPGVLVIWLQNNAYLTIANMSWGPKVVADLAASRLWVMPLVTVFGGWSRVFLNTVSRLVSEKNYIQIAQIKTSGVRYLILGHLLFLFCVFVFLHSPLKELVPEKYSGASIYIYLWIGFSLVSCWRGITTQIAQAFGGFSHITKLTIISASISLVAIGFSSRLGNEILLIPSLAIGEFVILYAMTRHLRSKLVGSVLR